MNAVDDPQEEPPAALFRRWVHAHEEDHDDVSVYRPTGYAFPPARGRSGVEFRTDGTFVDHPIGRGDAPASVPGFWHAQDERRITLSFPGTGRPERVVEIVTCDPEVLRLRHPG
ncbi:hypothetical protein AB0K89_11670 [Streptomyces cinnamoneus]|uniref:hypothetical protein n=1 Tax=Streptomyces cinnamoneus TaxID=53446 RepID=UPI003415CC48